MKLFKYTWPLFLLIVPLASCTVEKRFYRPGVHVEWNKGTGNRQEAIGNRSQGSEKIINSQKETPKEQTPEVNHIVKNNEIKERTSFTYGTTESNCAEVDAEPEKNAVPTTKIKATAYVSELEAFAIGFSLIGLALLIIGLLLTIDAAVIPLAATTLLIAGGTLMLIGFILFFISDPEGTFDACGTVCINGLLEILFGILCGSF